MSSIDHIQAELVSVEPFGWRLVPTVPTPEWIGAVADDGYADCDVAQLIASILSHAPAAVAVQSELTMAARQASAPQEPSSTVEHSDTTRLRTLAALTGNWPLDLVSEHNLQIREMYPKGPTTLEGVRWVLDLVATSQPSDDPRRNLEKAGALILAEMERIDRAAARAQTKEQP